MKLIPQWFVALILYLIIVVIIFLAKPALLFNKDGTFKKFSTGFVEGNSVFAISIAFPVIAFVCYIFASLFKLALL
jgi:hypothetical protein